MPKPYQVVSVVTLLAAVVPCAWGQAHRAKIAVMETAFQKRGDAASFQAAKAAGYAGELSFMAAVRGADGHQVERIVVHPQSIMTPSYDAGSFPHIAAP